MVRRSKERDTTAIGKDAASLIQSEVRRIAANFFAFSDPQLTEEEFIAAFVVKEHVPMLRKTQEICGSIDSRGNVSSKIATPLIEVRTTIRFPGREPPIPIPDYVHNGLTADCPFPLREQLVNWAIMLPCLAPLTIKANVPKAAQLVDKMNSGTKFNLPALPPQVRQRIQAASAFMLSVMMITTPAVKDNILIQIERDAISEGARKALFHGVTTRMGVPTYSSKV